ncbi:MAG TPA: glycoside hydrolase family 2 TIM barrel-domain containing protein [Opitutaceae bacterium]
MNSSMHRIPSSRFAGRLARAWFAVALLASAALSASARERLAFDAGWVFFLGDAPGAEAPGFDASAWRRVDLPHDWSIALPVDPAAPDAGNGGFFPTGVGWYRRTFKAPKAWREQRVAIEFEGVYMNAEVWINGTSLGRHPYGYTPIRHDLTPHLRWDADNVLSVRVDNSAQPNSRWYTGSGLYRHAWLHVTAPVHVATDGVFVTTQTLAPERAIVRVETRLRNAAQAPFSVTVQTSLLDVRGRTVAFVQSSAELPAGGEAVVAPELAIAQPRAWSPDSPSLYTALTRLRLGRRMVDEVRTTVGVRTVRVSAENGFELNGRPLKLLGGNVHHDTGLLGAAAFDRAEERKVQLLKAAGYNAVRTAHNPPSPAFLDACDRLGLLVVNEAFDGWAKGKNPHDYSVVFNEWWQRDVAAFVRRDRNHPSVVIWSTGNEMFERGNASGQRIARELAAHIRALDPTRPISAGVNGMGQNGQWTQLDPLFAAFDIAGYNYELHRHAADHARLPSRVIMAAESYQNEAFANWAAMQDHPYVVGDFVWSALDYLGEAGIGRVFPPDEPVVKHWEGNQFPWHGAYCGDIDLTGWRKPVSHYRAIVWDRGEKLYAAVLVPAPDGKPWNLSPWSVPPALPAWTWPGHEGRPLTVEVYSRHEAVRLLLNGAVIGEKPTTRAEEFKAVFEIPYTPGELVAVGLADGREVERFVLKTAGAAAALRVTVDRSTLRADGQDLAYLTLEAVDGAGVLNPHAALSVTLQLEGAGTLAAFGTGDLTSMESYQARTRTLHQGRAVAVIRAADAKGRIHVTASAPGVKPAKLSLRCVRP